MQITAVGHAHASFPPERATLHMRLGAEGSEKHAVLEHTTILVQGFSAAVAQMKALTPSPTTWSAVAPIGTRSWRPWSEGGSLPLRHAADCLVQLMFRDFQALARFMDQWGGRDGVTIDSVGWSLTEPRREVEDERVLTQAVLQARARATTMARAAGEQGVRFLELADRGLLHDNPPEDGFPIHAASFRAGAAGGNEGITIAPEDVHLNVTVHARFTTD
ncbi:SIMPL domain-containing protein [Tessaracoccus sp.]